MKHSLPPRLRAVGLFAIVMVPVLVIGGATHGWSTVIDVVPVPLVVIAALYLLGARDTDAGALARRQLDERQAYQRLRVQALVGRVLSGAVAIAYLIASGTKTTLWPWASLLGVGVVTLIAGWLIYGERGARGADDTVA